MRLSLGEQTALIHDIVPCCDTVARRTVDDLEPCRDPQDQIFLRLAPELDVKTVNWQLQAGDLVFLYTDGFPEQQNSDAEEFGIEAVEALLVEYQGDSLAAIAELLHKRVKKFRGDHPRGDDEALVLIRYLGNENKGA